MPRVKPLITTPEMKRIQLRELAVQRIEHELSDFRIKRKEVAAAAGISEASVSNQFKNKRLSMDVYLACEDIINTRRGEKCETK